MTGWMRALAATSALICAVSPASAEPVHWKSVRGWDISYYPETAGCQAHAVFADGTAFFIGFDQMGATRSLDLTVLNDAWRFLAPGQPYEASLRFDDETPWQVAVTGLEINGFPGLLAHVPAGSRQARMLAQEFTRKHYMHWQVQDTELGRFPLRGSGRAYREVEACQNHLAPKPVARTVVPLSLAQ